ncbi:MAG: DUF192 domain-containing protein [Elusimicrobia bacterium]|nr:DUF192 domain-containing protein [Elusimicrobiota bacterium]
MATLIDDKGRVLLDNLEIADAFFSRLKGFLGRKFLDRNSGLLLIPCGSIHMFFMKFAIDVFFLREKSGNFEVLKKVRGLKPWRIAIAPSCTQAVLETAVGALAEISENAVFKIGGDNAFAR